MALEKIDTFHKLWQRGGARAKRDSTDSWCGFFLKKGSRSASYLSDNDNKQDAFFPLILFLDWKIL